MTAHKVTYLTLIFFALISCFKKSPISEEKILSDIFPQLIDSLQIKWRPFRPTLPLLLWDKDSNIIGVDSTKIELDLSEHQKYLDRFDSIDSRTLIALSDSCFLIDWNDLKSTTYSEDSLISELISMNEFEKYNSRVFNLNQINIPDSIRLLAKSEIEKKHTSIWASSLDHKFAGLLEISRIYLSGENDFGLLRVDYYYIRWDGYSYYIIIEKVDGKWQVKKLLCNWVS
jgi:hypothetical protein